MDLVPSWVKLAALGMVAAGALGYVSYQVHHQRDIGRKEVRQKWDAERAEQAEQLAELNAEYRRIEQRRQSIAGEIEKAKNEKIASINSRLVAALGELQNRPDRSATASDTPACQGATGAGLSRPDAGFLEGEAARANTIRAGLAACYAQYDSLIVTQPAAK